MLEILLGWMKMFMTTWTNFVNVPNIKGQIFNAFP